MEFSDFSGATEKIAPIVRKKWRIYPAKKYVSFSEILHKIRSTRLNEKIWFFHPQSTKCQKGVDLLHHDRNNMGGKHKRVK